MIKSDKSGDFERRDFESRSGFEGVVLSCDYQYNKFLMDVITVSACYLWSIKSPIRTGQSL